MQSTFLFPFAFFVCSHLSQTSTFSFFLWQSVFLSVFLSVCLPESVPYICKSSLVAVYTAPWSAVNSVTSPRGTLSHTSALGSLTVWGNLGIQHKAVRIRNGVKIMCVLAVVVILVYYRQHNYGSERLTHILLMTFLYSIYIEKHALHVQWVRMIMWGYGGDNTRIMLCSVYLLTLSIWVLNDSFLYLFLGYFLELLNRSAISLQETFIPTWGPLYSQNAQFFSDLYTDLRHYYRGSNVNLEEVLNEFWARLLEKIFYQANKQYSIGKSSFFCRIPNSSTVEIYSIYITFLCIYKTINDNILFSCLQM